ncbi:tRNA (adenosine(37)-N6)-dimethylallyltransferase MiaA [Actinomyces culturomici]|uniref:tRNA (adenosine(37)-N6)-dimethylallyltransferase MiaA n=1 Tax=Actinomyces culturomici TaxID=1926276 RepID=UPI000E1FFE78|nr:tRNA (adenosine(37)-N6)-dimethylallyltransferase MiaA [Actinomyces culturomici]
MRSIDTGSTSTPHFASEAAASEAAAPATRAPARGAPSSDAARLERPGDLLVAVVGPTASGKSDLGLDLAESLPAVLGAGPGEIVSADALQLYRGMDIGTAKTPVAERRGSPHHQIDVLDLLEEASVARYQKESRADVAAIHARGGVGVVAGGSGLYQRALLDRLDFPGTDPRVRAELEAEAEGPLGSRGLHARLAALDPLSAERIDPHNARRIIRALEVIALTGEPYSSRMPEKVFAAPSVMIAIRRDLDVLDERIRMRTEKMFADGLLEETRALLDLGLREARTARKATGYAEAIAVIDGEMTTDEAAESISIATRQLARRQIKWLRPDARVHWLDAEGDAPLLDRTLDLVRQTVDDELGAAAH